MLRAQGQDDAKRRSQRSRRRRLGMEPERRRYPRMREVVFRVLPERPGHPQAQAVGAAFSAGVTLPIRITAPTLEELQHDAREALIEHLGLPIARFGCACAVTPVLPSAASGRWWDAALLLSAAEPIRWVLRHLHEPPLTLLGFESDEEPTAKLRPTPREGTPAGQEMPGTDAPGFVVGKTTGRPGAASQTSAAWAHATSGAQPC
ncbi:MAG: hypothetical protein ACKOPT_01645 [Cyanobium sp.]